MKDKVNNLKVRGEDYKERFEGIERNRNIVNILTLKMAGIIMASFIPGVLLRHLLSISIPLSCSSLTSGTLLLGGTFKSFSLPSRALFGP